MELSWSTFLLEIVNFLVLVWILKRFLYKPVVDVIARRREKIEQTMRAAKEKHRAGEALQAQYENRLADWEGEKEAARTTFHREIEQERVHRLETLATELEAERKKREVVAERERLESERRLENQALVLAAGFAARLLSRVAGAELERRLVEVLQEDLPRLSAERRRTLEQALLRESGPIEVTSAYPLDDAGQRKLEQVLADLAGRPVACRYRQDSSLIAGAQLRVGAWVLHVDIRDELRGFTEAGHE